VLFGSCCAPNADCGFRRRCLSSGLLTTRLDSPSTLYTRTLLAPRCCVCIHRLPTDRICGSTRTRAAERRDEAPLLTPGPPHVQAIRSSCFRNRSTLTLPYALRMRAVSFCFCGKASFRAREERRRYMPSLEPADFVPLGIRNAAGLARLAPPHCIALHDLCASIRVHRARRASVREGTEQSPEEGDDRVSAPTFTNECLPAPGICSPVRSGSEQSLRYAPCPDSRWPRQSGQLRLRQMRPVSKRHKAAARQLGGARTRSEPTARVMLDSKHLPTQGSEGENRREGEREGGSLSGVRNLANLCCNRPCPTLYYIIAVL
jgi:hypothetical protein